MRLQQCWIQQDNHNFWQAVLDSSQDVVGPLDCQGTQLTQLSLLSTSFPPDPFLQGYSAATPISISPHVQRHQALAVPPSLIPIPPFHSVASSFRTIYFLYSLLGMHSSHILCSSIFTWCIYPHAFLPPSTTVSLAILSKPYSCTLQIPCKTSLFNSNSQLWPLIYTQIL